MPIYSWLNLSDSRMRFGLCWTQQSSFQRRESNALLVIPPIARGIQYDETSY